MLYIYIYTTSNQRKVCMNVCPCIKKKKNSGKMKRFVSKRTLVFCLVFVVGIYSSFCAHWIDVSAEISKCIYICLNKLFAIRGRVEYLYR